MPSKFGLIGYKLSHSMSPYIHNCLFNIAGTCAEYEIYEIPPQDFQDEKECRRWIEQLKGLDGFNITIPHKETILKFLHERDQNVFDYKSSNTVLVTKEGHFNGYNTDAYGFVSALQLGGLDLSGIVVVLGNGGVSKTMAYEASKTAQKVIIVARNEMKSKNIIENISIKNKDIEIQSISFEEFNAGHVKSDIIVNGTPVGMYPNANVCPVSNDAILASKGVFDSIYNPKETQLIKNANQLAVPAVGGMAMLVLQAARAQEIWLGNEFTKAQLNMVIEKAQIQLGAVYGQQ